MNGRKSAPPARSAAAAEGREAGAFESRWGYHLPADPPRGLSSQPRERSMVEPLNSNREKILRLAAAHGARNVRVFGSMARGTATPASDVDLLVDMEPGRSQLDLVALWQDLEDLLARKVDLVTDGGLSPYLRGQIESEARPL